MLKPTVAAAEFEKYGFKRCKGKQYEECYYLCVAHGCVMLFVSDVCFDIFKWDETDPRIHKEANCRYRDKRDCLDVIYDLIKAGMLERESGCK
jgi:hypothetical protein|nr:MAG TPA: hypothetical protein [Caudoviricetes sp.]